MRSLSKQHSKFILFIPVIGMIGFVLFYGIAAYQYPGGSYADYQQPGFSWQHNYLCDLLDSQAINGENNVASTPSRIAFGFLCFTMMYIWYHFPKLFQTKHINHQIIRVSGILSMVIALFLASGIHDTIVYIAGGFGLIALIFTYIELYKHHFYTLLIIGIVCVLLTLANYVIYYTDFSIRSLPIIQKITFVCCISWFLMLMVRTYKRV